jgi:hypothetical protein
MINMTVAVNVVSTPVSGFAYPNELKRPNVPITNGTVSRFLAQRKVDDPYSIVASYQAEYRGLVQYYRLAYNLHTLSHLKYVMEVSLVKTLAGKYRTTCSKIYRRYGATIHTDEGDRKVIRVQLNRPSPKEPLIAYFGSVALKNNKWAAVNEQLTKPIWSGRSEVVERLLAQECELCGATDPIEVHAAPKGPGSGRCPGVGSYRGGGQRHRVICGTGSAVAGGSGAARPAGRVSHRDAETSGYCSPAGIPCCCSGHGSIPWPERPTTPGASGVAAKHGSRLGASR